MFVIFDLLFRCSVHFLWSFHQIFHFKNFRETVLKLLNTMYLATCSFVYFVNTSHCQFTASHNGEIVTPRSAIYQLATMVTLLADDNFKCIFVNESDRIAIRISRKFVSRSPIDNKLALVQVMAWRRPGDKPLSEPMPTQLTDVYKCHWGGGGGGYSVEMLKCLQNKLWNQHINRL